MNVHPKSLVSGIAVVSVFVTVVLAVPVSSFGQSMNAADNRCSGPGSTADTAACFTKARDDEDRKLNELYARIQKVLEPEEKTALVQAERLWVQYRDATCDAERTLYGRGTGGPPAKIACLAAETKSRRESLLRSYGWVLEKRG